MTLNPLTSRFSPSRAVVGATAFCILTGAIMASPIIIVSKPKPEPEKPKFRVTADQRPERHEKSIEGIFDNRNPHHPANEILDDVTTAHVDGMRARRARGATGGVESKEYKEGPPPEEPSPIGVYGEYSHGRSNDKRQLDLDSISNAGSGGVDFTLGNTLVGLIYYYSHIKQGSGFLRSSTSSDSHFFSLYAAHPINDFLTVGLTGGYGHTGVRVQLLRPPGRVRSDTDSWSGSPFVSLAWASGNAYASFTTTYQFLHTDQDDSGQLNLAVAGGYQITEWLSAELNTKFTQFLHNSRNGEPEDDNWYAVGAKFKQNITPNLALYEAYEFRMNDTFEENMVTGGITYSF